jgi:hypothetical protein
MQPLSVDTSEGSPCLYMAACRESIAFVKTVSCQIHEFKWRHFTGDRIRMGSVILLVAIETTNARQSREGLIVGRKEELDDLITAFDRAVHEDDPNPERVSCPGRPALTALAKKAELVTSDSLLDHIRHCAACLDELKELRRGMQRSQ